MKHYEEAFLNQMRLIEEIEKQLEVERKKLQDLCPHVHLNGRSAFPGGLSFTNCELCGMSSYYAGS